jgi:hypothetical protein
MMNVRYHGVSADLNGCTWTDCTENRRTTDFISNHSVTKRANLRIPTSFFFSLSTFISGTASELSMKFQALCNTSMSLCAEQLCLNYLLGLGNIPLRQWRMNWHEWACHNRQLCGLPTDSLALTFIPYFHIVPFSCIMCSLYYVMWAKQFQHRCVIMARQYFTVKGCSKFCQRTVMKNVQWVRKVAVLRYVDLVVSIEIAIEVCCCFTVFSC